MSVDMAELVAARGYDAIELARADSSIRLNKFSDAVSDAARDISIEQAMEIAREDPGLVYATRR